MKAVLEQAVQVGKKGRGRRHKKENKKKVLIEESVSTEETNAEQSTTNDTEETCTEESTAEEEESYAFHPVNGLTAFSHNVTHFKPERFFIHAHEVLVLWVAFSKTAKFMVSCGADKSIVLWTLNKNRNFIRIQCEAVVRHAVFSPDEKYLAICCGGNIEIYWIEGNVLRHTIKAHDDDILGVDFSPSGEFICSACADATFRIWGFKHALEQGKHSGMGSCKHDSRRAKGRHSDQVYRGLFSHSGKYVLTCSKDTTIKRWDFVKACELLETYAAHTASVLGIAWTADDTRFASCSHDSKVIVWRPGEVTPLFVLKGHTSVVYTVAFCPTSTCKSGRLVSCGHDSRLIFWDYVHLGRIKNTLPSGSNGWTMCVAFRPGCNEILTCSSEAKSSILMWSAYPAFMDYVHKAREFWRAIWGGD